MKNQTIQRNIRFTIAQIELGETIAETLGMSFNSWVKFVISKELELFLKSNKVKEIQSAKVKIKKDSSKEEIYRLANLTQYLDENDYESDEGEIELPY